MIIEAWRGSSKRRRSVGTTGGDDPPRLFMSIPQRAAGGHRGYVGTGVIRRIVRAASLVALVLGIWAAVLIAMPFVGPAGRTVAVVGDGAAAVRAIRTADGAVVEVRRGATLARSTRPGFVRALYAAGAPLVIEGRVAAGCFAKAGA